MSYKLEWNASPNFTPGSQTQAFYGRPRSLDMGAGHWWNTPEAGARHDGIVSIFKNPARQGSAHAVLSAGRVTEMVRASDTAWCTSNANPYTYAIEVDPRIMYKWTSSGANKTLGNQIFETLCEYIADKRYHNLPWKAHNQFPVPYTQCNPIHWNEVMIRAKQIRAQKDAPPNPTKPVPAAQKLSEGILTFRAKLPLVQVWDLATNPNYKSVKTLKQGETIDCVAFIDFNNTRYYVTQYSYEKGLKVGVNRNDVEIVRPDPEWIRNLKDITDVKLMVLAPTAVIYDLNTGKAVGSPIPQKTWIDIAKQTVVGGKTYLISKYSVDNAMPNGILKDALGLPAPDPIPEPPKPQPEPEWLKNWQDIADIDMYTRKADVEVVNLLDGSTTTTIPAKGEKIAIASSTEWMGQKYLITKYSTDKKLPHGIRLVDLDIKPVDPGTDPIPPDPDKPVDDLIRENNSLLKQILALLQQIWNKITGKQE